MRRSVTPCPLSPPPSRVNTKKNPSPNHSLTFAISDTNHSSDRAPGTAPPTPSPSPVKTAPAPAPRRSVAHRAAASERKEASRCHRARYHWEIPSSGSTRQLLCDVLDVFIGGDDVGGGGVLLMLMVGSEGVWIWCWDRRRHRNNTQPTAPPLQPPPPRVRSPPAVGADVEAEPLGRRRAAAARQRGGGGGGGGRRAVDGVAAAAAKGLVVVLFVVRVCVVLSVCVCCVLCVVLSVCLSLSSSLLFPPLPPPSLSNTPTHPNQTTNNKHARTKQKSPIYLTHRGPITMGPPLSLEKRMEPL